VPAHTATQDHHQHHHHQQQQPLPQIHQLSQRPPLLQQRIQHRTSHAFPGRVHCSVSSRTGISTQCSRQGGLLLQAGISLHEAWGSSSSSSSSRCLSSSARAWRPGGGQVSASSAGAAQILEELSKLREGGEAQVGGMCRAQCKYISLGG
jgi:hypothetical protein